MLSEEEKEAIEKLKKIREDTIKANKCGLSNNDFKEEIEVYNTVLNIITKLQKENEKKDKRINRQYKLLNKKDKEINKLKKQIDLMADKLVEAHEWFYSEFDNFTKEDFIEYFETKAKKEQ